MVAGLVKADWLVGFDGFGHDRTDDKSLASYSRLLESGGFGTDGRCVK